jgi:hypothetical protein
MSMPVEAAGPTSGRGKTKWFAFGALGVAAAAFVFIAVGGIGENLVYYWGPKELRAAGAKALGATIRLGGQVAVGSIKRGEEREKDQDTAEGRDHVYQPVSGAAQGPRWRSAPAVRRGPRSSASTS